MKSAAYFLLLLGSSTFFAGCRTISVSANGPSLPKPQQIIVLVDLSASRSPGMKTDAQSFLHEEVNQLTFGDKMVLMEVQQSGLHDHPRMRSTDMPTLRDPTFISTRDRSSLRAAQAGAMIAVDSFFRTETGTAAQNTDLLTTIELAGEQLHDAEGRDSTILLLSDMLQSAQGIEMERLARMPGVDWIAKQKSLRLIPNLSDACVVVIGADATSAAGLKVRSFWQQYFSASGAPLVDARYRVMPPPPHRNLCG